MCDANVGCGVDAVEGESPSKRLRNDCDASPPSPVHSTDSERRASGSGDVTVDDGMQEGASFLSIYPDAPAFQRRSTFDAPLHRASEISAADQISVVMLNGQMYQYPSSALNSMTPPATVARKCTLDKSLFFSGLKYCGIPYMVSLDKTRAWICPQTLPMVFDYLIASADGTFKAFDLRYILYVTSIRTFLIQQDEPPASFTASFIGSLMPKVFGEVLRPLEKMDPCQLGLQLDMPFQSNRKGSTVKCETPGCTKRTGTLDENLMTVGLHVCTKCLGLDNFVLGSEIKKDTAASKLVNQFSQPQVGLAMVGSALQTRPLNAQEYDRNVAFAKSWFAIVGLERGFDQLGILRHTSKLMPNVKPQEAMYAVHQLTWLGNIDKALMQQMIELGCTHYLKVKTPAQAARRSFKPKKEALMTSYPSAIVVVPYPTKEKSQRYMRVDAIISVAAVVWGMSRVSIVGSLVAIEHHISQKYKDACSGSLIQTVDAREVPYAKFDMVEKPVVVVTNAVLLTWRSILTLMASGAAHIVLHTEWPIMVHGYYHPLWKCVVGGPLNVLRKLAHDSYKTHKPHERNPCIFNTGFQSSIDMTIPKAHREALDEAAEFSKVAAAGLEFEAGHAPQWGETIAPLGDQPLSAPYIEGAVQALVSEGTRFAHDNRKLAASTKRQLVTRLASGEPMSAT